MVHRRSVGRLIQLAIDFDYVFERARSVCDISPPQLARVKGDTFLLDVLNRNLPNLEALSKQNSSFTEVYRSVYQWVAYLDKRYADKWTLGVPEALEFVDAQNLSKDAHHWMEVLSTFYSSDGTVLITQESLSTLFPDSLVNNLDESTRKDLDDGINCIFNLLPTPAVMILFRVAENVVRKYYEKITGKPASKMNWAQIVSELETSQQSRKHLLGYLDYLRDKRNEAEHPDKRFTQEESERVLMDLKGLIEELSK